MRDFVVFFLIVAVVIAAVSLLLRALSSWRATRIMARMLDEIRHPERHPAKPDRKLDPESRFIVRLSDEDVYCERPDGQIERIAWRDLQRVEILNTEDGPFLPDIFWVLSGADSGFVIPWGATGDRELLERLQQLPNFDNTAVTESSLTTRHSMRLCWRTPS